MHTQQQCSHPPTHTRSGNSCACTLKIAIKGESTVIGEFHGQSSSIKLAEQKAAEVALEELNVGHQERTTAGGGYTAVAGSKSGGTKAKGDDQANGGKETDKKASRSNAAGRKPSQESSAVVASWEALADDGSEGKAPKGGKGAGRTKGKGLGGGWDADVGSDSGRRETGEGAERERGRAGEDGGADISPDDAKNVLQVCVESGRHSCQCGRVTETRDSHICSCMAAWLHGCMAAWLHGCMAAWLHGCISRCAVTLLK